MRVGFNSLNDRFSFEILPKSGKLFEESEMPLVFMLGELDGRILVDMTSVEMKAVDSLYIASFRRDGGLVGIRKVDGRPVSLGIINSVIGKARELLV